MQLGGYVVYQARRERFRIIVRLMPVYAIPTAPPPRGMIAIGIFLLFGATMACIAGITLVHRGTVLDRMWALNPGAYRELAPFGRTVGIPFLLLAVALAVSGLGWLKRQRWGWQVAVFIIAIQVFGDFVNVVRGHLVQGGAGMAIAGALLYYMLRPNIRAAFVSKQRGSDN